LAALQAERDTYLRALHAWAWQQVTPQELQEWAEDDAEEGVSFDQMLQELESREP
jgi:hypothetical protein